MRAISTVGLARSSSLTSLAVWRTKRFRTLYNILPIYKLIVDKVSRDLLFSLFMPSSFEMDWFMVYGVCVCVCVCLCVCVCVCMCMSEY